VVRPHTPGYNLVLLDADILPAGPPHRLGRVPHLHSHVVGIPVRSLQLTSVAL